MLESAEKIPAVSSEHALIHAYDGRKRRRERGVGVKNRIKEMRRHCL